jgi:hypothetical protein
MEMDSTYGANKRLFCFYKAVVPTAQEDLQITFKHRYLPQRGYRFVEKTS